MGAAAVEVTEEVADKPLDEYGRGVVEAPEEMRVETGDIGVRETEVITEPLQASELWLCIFFAIVLIITMWT